MLKVDHIVFDIGRVLVHWDVERIYRRLIPDDAERRDFLQNVCNAAWNREQDRGRSWADGEKALIERFPDQADRIRAFRENWLLCVPDVVPGVPELMRGLIAEGRDVTLLTNFSRETYPLALERFGFLAEARGATVSGEVGLVKPDPAIYALHSRTFGLVDDRTLLIDDSYENAAAARQFGWHAVEFTDASSLADTLRSLVR